MAGNTQRKKKIADITPIRMNNEALAFPVSYGLKAVMAASLSDTENKKLMTDVFDTLKIDYTYLSKTRSSKGAYVSFTYKVTLADRRTMNQLYTLLKEIENLKFAL